MLNKKKWRSLGIRRNKNIELVYLAKDGSKTTRLIG
jgi:hypothetical protein